MPFRRKSSPLSLDSFEPDDDHDSIQDLIEVSCGDDVFYAYSPRPSVWKVDSVTMPDTILAEFRAQKQLYASTHGIEVDRAVVGEPVLLSLLNFDWVGIWRSVNPVTGLKPVQRHVGLKSSNGFPIEKNT